MPVARTGMPAPVSALLLSRSFADRGGILLASKPFYAGWEHALQKLMPRGDRPGTSDHYCPGCSGMIYALWVSRLLRLWESTVGEWLLPHRVTNGASSAEGYCSPVWMACVPRLTIWPCANAGYLAASWPSTSTHSW